MWLAESVYETYRDILLKTVPTPISDGLFITLEELAERLALKSRDIPGLIHDIRHSLRYSVHLAKAPAAYKESRRYHFDGQEWVFMSMYKL